MEEMFQHQSKVMVGESGGVSCATVSSWKERLPVITERYEAEDIYNLDGTGCFWRALPEQGFTRPSPSLEWGVHCMEVLQETWLTERQRQLSSHPSVDLQKITSPLSIK